MEGSLVSKKKYVFVGNREYILRNMMEKQLQIVAVWVLEGSFLHNRLVKDPFIEYEVITDKEQLLKRIQDTEFDILISNGCKYVLPVEQMKKRTYINIHPSFLPDLRGRNPELGSILFDRDAGGTCHLIDSGIDTGPVIAQKRIPATKDIEGAILFQLLFKAEVLAFHEAFQRNFEPLPEQKNLDGTIYITMKPEHRLIHLENGVNYILRQVRALGYRSKGLYFKCNGENFRFFRASEVINPFAVEIALHVKERQVFLRFENSIVFKLNGRLLRFDQIEDSDGKIAEGDYIENGDCVVEVS